MWIHRIHTGTRGSWQNSMKQTLHDANRYAPMPFTWNVKNMGAEDRPGHVSNGNTFMVGSYSSVAVVYDTKQLKYYFTDSMPLGNYMNTIRKKQMFRYITTLHTSHVIQTIH